MELSRIWNTQLTIGVQLYKELWSSSAAVTLQELEQHFVIWILQLSVVIQQEVGRVCLEVRGIESAGSVIEWNDNLERERERERERYSETSEQGDSEMQPDSLQQPN